MYGVNEVETMKPSLKRQDAALLSAIAAAFEKRTDPTIVKTIIIIFWYFSVERHEQEPSTSPQQNISQGHSAVSGLTPNLIF